MPLFCITSHGSPGFRAHNFGSNFYRSQKTNLQAFSALTSYMSFLNTRSFPIPNSFPSLWYRITCRLKKLPYITKTKQLSWRICRECSEKSELVWPSSRVKRNSSVRSFLAVSPLHSSYRAHYGNYITGSHSSTSLCSASCLCLPTVCNTCSTNTSIYLEPTQYAMGVWGCFPQGCGTAEGGVDFISHLHLFLV